MKASESDSPTVVGTSLGGDSSDSGSNAGGIAETGNPPVPPTDVTHESADQVPHYRRARWIRAHSEG